MRLEALAGELAAELEPAAAGGVEVAGVAGLGDAGGASLLFAETAGALGEAQRAGTGAGAAAILTTRALHEEVGGARPVLLVEHPKLAFARAARLLREVVNATGVHPTAVVPEALREQRGISVGPYAVVGEGCRVGADARIDAGAVLGADCTLGEGCHIYPRAVLYPGTTLGARCVVHAGAVLGADGFGYVRDAGTGGYVQFPQQGRLVLEDDVEVGANATIDRGALGETRIGRGVKIDNLVHVGHNVRVGADVVIAAQTGISGSSVIGEGAVLAGQVGIADHVEVGPGVILGAQCGVPSRKKVRGAGVVFWGTPARPIGGYLRELAALARLGRRRQ